MESKFGYRNLQAENHWKACDIETIKVTKPIIVCLSGSGTINENDANGFCKVAEDFLGEKASDVDFFGIAYAHEEGSIRGELSNKDIDLLVDNILIPLCKDDDNILSVEECCKNLSLVTFFTFCHGNIEVSKILKHFNSKMQNVGLSQDQIKEIDQSLFEINYAKESGLVSCPQINTSSAADTIGSLFDYWYFDGHGEDKLKGRYAMICDNPGQFCGKDWPRPDEKQFGAITIIADSILKNKTDNDLYSFQSKEHSIGNFEDEDKLSDEGIVLKQSLSYALQRRVENSILNQNNTNYTRFYLQNLYSDLIAELPRTNRINDNDIEDKEFKL